MARSLRSRVGLVVLLAACLLLVLLVLPDRQPRPSPATRDGRSAPSAEQRSGPVSARLHGNAEARTTDGPVLRGIVRDEATGEPIEGVLVELVRIAREEPDASSQSMVAWQAMPGDIEFARAGRMVRGQPLPWTERDAESTRSPGSLSGDWDSAFESAHTDASGRFQLAVRRAELHVGFRHPAYVVEVLPVPSGGKGLHVGLEPSLRLYGDVVPAAGVGPVPPLELGFVRAEDGRMWTCQTASGGAFEVAVGAGDLVPIVLTPGHVLVWPVLSFVARPSMPLQLAVRNVATIRVTDRETGSAIDMVSLVARHRRSSSVAIAGMWHTRDGLLSLASSRTWPTLGSQAVDVAVWADGYDVAVLRMERVDTRLVHDVRLVPGGRSAIEGTIRLDDRPLPGASVRLALMPPLEGPWRLDQLLAVADTRSDASGDFRLQAPPGRYAVTVAARNREATRVVEVPADHPLLITLGSPAEVRVALRDVHGNAVPLEGLALVHSDSGRLIYEVSDEQGIAAFAPLPAGTYDLLGGAGLALRLERLSVVSGETREVEVRWSRPAVETTMLRVDGVSDFSGWRVRNLYRGDVEWRDVDPGGHFRHAGARGLLIESPSGHAWRVVSRSGFDQTGVSIDTDGLALRGILTTNDVPIAGARVWARVAGQHALYVGATTDVYGAFQLGGLRPTAYSLTFEAEGDMFEGVSVELDLTGQAPGAPLRLEVPSLPPNDPGSGHRGLAPMAVDGVLLDSAGDPAAGAILDVTAQLPRDYGTLLVRAPRGRSISSSDGRFECLAYQAPSHRVRVWRHAGTPRQTSESFVLRAGPELEIRLRGE